MDRAAGEKITGLEKQVIFMRHILKCEIFCGKKNGIFVVPY
jgi:hypothetical protein